MDYKELKTGIRDHLNNAAEDFFMVGYYLRQISESTLFIEDGYKSIWEFAKGEYGLSTSSASRFMAINARFSIDGGEHMDQKYIGMGPSKLQEMLGLSDEDLEKVTQETTVKELRAMKAAKLSYYKLPKTVRPEGSLLTTAGCGGKYDCFSCSRVCGLRQESRQCVISGCGNPKPCKNVTADAQADMEAGMYKDECLFLHQDELAEKRAGDGEPTPCCRACKYKGLCYSSCDVAKAEYQKEIEDTKKKAKAELEAKKADPTKKDIADFYKWAGFTTSDEITAEALKKRYRHAGGGGGLLKDYQGSSRGIAINYKKEMTYAKLAKALKEVQEEARKDEERKRRIDEALGIKKSDPNEIPEPIQPEPEEKPDIIDAEFKEVEAVPAEAAELIPAEPEQEVIEQQPDPEEYDADDVKEYLRRFKHDLEELRKLGGPAKPLKKNRIITDALQLLLKEKEAAVID